MGTIMVLVVVLLWPVVAAAELFVCFRANQPLGRQFYADIRPIPGQHDPACTLIPPGTPTEAQQLALIQRVIRDVPASQYLKVQGGLAVEMSEVEKDAVDTFVASERARRQAYVVELEQNVYCAPRTLEARSARVADLRTAVQADVAAGNVAEGLAKLIEAFEQMVRCDLAQARGHR